MFSANMHWLKSLIDEKAKAVLDGFIGIINESKRKPNKLLVDLRITFTIISHIVTLILIN